MAFAGMREELRDALNHIGFNDQLIDAAVDDIDDAQEIIEDLVSRG